MKRLSPLLIIAAVIAVIIAALKGTEEAEQSQAWKPVEPS